MKFTGATRIILEGNKDLSSQYVGIGRRFLGMLDRDMGLNQLSQLYRRHEMADGTVIVVENVFGQHKLTIDTTGVGTVKKLLPEEPKIDIPFNDPEDGDTCFYHTGIDGYRLFSELWGIETSRALHMTNLPYALASYTHQGKTDFDAVYPELAVNEINRDTNFSNYLRVQLPFTFRWLGQDRTSMAGDRFIANPQDETGNFDGICSWDKSNIDQDKWIEWDGFAGSHDTWMWNNEHGYREAIAFCQGHYGSQLNSPINAERFSCWQAGVVNVGGLWRRFVLFSAFNATNGFEEYWFKRYNTFEGVLLDYAYGANENEILCPQAIGWFFKECEWGWNEPEHTNTLDWQYGTLPYKFPDDDVDNWHAEDWWEVSPLFVGAVDVDRRPLFYLPRNGQADGDWLGSKSLWCVLDENGYPLTKSSDFTDFQTTPFTPWRGRPSVIIPADIDTILSSQTLTRAGPPGFLKL